MIPRLYRRVALGGAITVCAFVGFFLIFPVATVVSRGFSIDALSDSLGSGRIQHVIWFTTWQALISSLLTICVGLPIVIVLYRYRFVGRRLLLALTTIPFVLPTVVVAAAFVFIIGNTQQGLVAIIVAHVYFNLAVVVRIVGAHLRSVGSKFEDVAATLGAGPSHRFFTVTLKLAKRAIINAFVVVFLFCFTSYGVVKIIGGIKYTTIDVEIYNQAVRLGNLQMATALSVIQLLLILVVLGVTSFSKRTLPFGVVSSPDLRPATTPIVLATWAMSAVLALPLIAIFLKSLRVNSSWTLAGWRQIETRPIINSLMFAVATTGIAVVVGIATACAIAYNKRAANVLPTLASLPLVISAVILGLGIIITFDQSPIEFRGSIWLLPVVHSLVALPLVFRVILPAINLVPTNIRGAASTMGAPPSRVWLTTDWPAIRRVLPLAASLSASVSLGEFGATSVLSRRDSQTMPMAISQLLGRPGDLNQLKAYALSALLVLIIAAIFFSLDTANA